MKQTSSVEMINPRTARNWLETSTGNRGREAGDKRIVSRERVEDLKGVILRGEWEVTNDAIAFDELGHLKNGHHRLTAIAESGVTVPCTVTRGLSQRAYFAMDNGMSRTLSQVLRERGEPYANNLAALTNNAFKFASGYGVSTRTHGTPTAYQALLFIEDNPEIRVSAHVGTLTAAAIHASALACGLAHFLISQVEDIGVDRELEAFYAGLKSGENVMSGDPIFELRSFFVSRRNKATLTEQVALIIKAWNYWRRGEKVHLLKWAGGGSRPERFPEPI